MTPASRDPDRPPGRPEQRTAFLAAAVEHVLTEGVATLSLRPLAAALGTSDRMLLYYFGTRENLLSAVLGAVGEQLQAHLTRSIPATTPSAPLVEQLWQALLAPAAEAHLRLYIEVSGLAARGREPFRAIAAAVAGSWLEWIEGRLDGSDMTAGARRDYAAGLLATLDGLLLVRFVASPQAAADAARWLLPRVGGHGPGAPLTDDRRPDAGNVHSHHSP